MRIAVIGSGFITPELLADLVRKHIPGAEIGMDRVPWPGKPRQATEEIREFAGTPRQVIEVAKGADALLTDLAPVSKEVLAALPELRLVGVARGGPVNVNVAAATERGVVVVNAPGRNGPAVAEYTIGLMLTILRKIPAAASCLKDGRWQGDFYTYEGAATELEGKQVGLIGFGQIGSRVAKVLKAFGAEVLVYDPFIDAALLKAAGAQPVSLAELIKGSHIISLHARLTAETTGLIGKRELSSMRSDAWLLNTARSGLIDTTALRERLAEGGLGGVALDVFDKEPPALDDPLLQFPNVLALPHVAGATKESAERGATMIVEDTRRFLVEGVRPLHCKNPEVLQEPAKKVGAL
jgi:D-3-phosphoglycerate dehydrogenase